VYTDPRVKEFVGERFVPVRVHVRENREEFQRLGARYSAQWTPAILIIDPEGQERYRIEGFLPVEDFLGQLELGVAHAAFKRNAYDQAERLFREVAEKHRQTDAAPEGLYWAGVSKYRATNDPGSLKATAQILTDRYPDSTWTKKASVWK
jgi:thioredoxin-related protein